MNCVFELNDAATGGVKGFFLCEAAIPIAGEEL